MRWVQVMAVVGMLAVTLRAMANEPVPPHGAMAFVQLDPRGFGPSTAWLASMLRTLDAAGVVRGEDRPVTDALLVATLLGSYPHTIALLDLRAQRRVPGEVEIDALQAVVSVPLPGPESRTQFQRTLQTILPHYGPTQTAEQMTFTLPGGRQAVRYRQAAWPAWFAVEWCADAGTFTLGLGEGSLQRWFEREGDSTAEAPDPRVAASLAAIAPLPAGQADHPLMLRLFADLDRLRAAAPTLFRTGRLSPILRIFGLNDAHAFMLQARWKGTFLLLGGSLSRGETTTATELSRDRWPTDAGVPMPAGRFHLVAPIDAPAAAVRLTALVGLLRNVKEWDDYDRFVNDHFGPELAKLTDHVARYRPVLMVSDHPKAWLPVPGTATVYVALRDGEPADVAATELQGLLAPALYQPGDPVDGVAVVTDPATGVQWLDSPLRNLFKSPAWGWTGQTLVVSYSPLAVVENHRWLTREKSRKSGEQQSRK